MKLKQSRVPSVRAGEGDVGPRAPVIYAVAATNDRPRIWIDDSERADIAARLRMIGDLLEHSSSDDLPEALDFARTTLARELERLS